MVLLYLVVFLMQGALCASETTAGEHIFAVDPEERSRRALEEIKSTVEGRIRFNNVILDMLNDNKNSIKERLSEFFENQGTSGKIFDEYDEEYLKRVLEQCIKNTNTEMNTILTTKLICAFIESGKIENLKGKFFLALNIYATIPHLKTYESHLTDSKRQSRISSDYSELTYYRKMLKILKDFDLPYIYHLERMFVTKDATVFFSFDLSFGLTNVLEKIKQLEEQISEKSKENGDDKLAEQSYELLKYREDLAEIDGELSRIEKTIKKSQNFDFLNFTGLKKFFDIVFWPYTKCELLVRDLRNKVNGTAQKIKKIQKKKQKRRRNDKPRLELSPEYSSDDSAAEMVTPDIDVLDTEGSVSAMECAPDLSFKTAHMVERILSPDTNQAIGTAAYDVLDTERLVSAVEFYPDLSFNPVHVAKKSKEESTAAEAHDWMKELKGESKKVDFMKMLKEFRNSLGAEIEKSQVTEITFRGPDQKLTKIFCHTPHGSQSEKTWPAWRYNMIKALEESGFKF